MDKDEAIAVPLHDVIEDQVGVKTHEKTRRKSGDIVATTVDGCADTERAPKPPWRIE